MTTLVNSVSLVKTPKDALALIKKAPTGREALKTANLCRNILCAEAISLNCSNQPFRMPAFYHIALSIDSKVFAQLFSKDNPSIPENTKLFKEFILACYTATFPLSYEALNAVLEFSIKYQHCIRTEIEEQHIKRLTSYPDVLLVKLYELAEKYDLQTLGNAIEFRLSELGKQCKTLEESAKLFSKFKGKNIRFVSVNIPGKVPLEMIVRNFPRLKVLDIICEQSDHSYLDSVYSFHYLDTLSMTFNNTEVIIPHSSFWKIRQLVIWRQNQDEPLIGSKSASDTIYCPSPSIYYVEGMERSVNMDSALKLASLAQKGAYLFNLKVIPNQFIGTDIELFTMHTFLNIYAGIEIHASHIKVVDKTKAFNKNELPT